MKSFFNFLRNNKAYAVIDVFGMSVSFMFVILIGAYAWQETHIGHCHDKADRIYAMGFTSQSGNRFTSGPWALQPHLRDAFPEIESTAAVIMTSPGFHIDDRDVVTNTLFVDSAFLHIFDIELKQGDPRTALADKHSVIVSEEYAKANFGDGDPIGKRFSWQADSVYFIVNGVMKMPEQSLFQTWDRKKPDMICRIEMEEYTGASWIFDKDMAQLGGCDLYLLAAPGVDLTENVDKYQQFMRDNFKNLSNIGTENEWKLEIFPLKSIYYDGVYSSTGNHISGDKDMVEVLAAVGGVVLLFAMLNYVNLTVALAGKRAKEMATRRLLGSRRAAIVGRLIGESALLCALSLAIGLLLAYLAEPYAYTLCDIYIDINACVTPATIALAVGVYAVISLSAGIIPAMLISSSKPVDVVRGTFRRRTKMYFSKVIIVVQNAITIAMIVCALGMFLQVRHLVNAPLGYDPSGKMMIRNAGIGEWRMKIIHDKCLQLPAIKKVVNCYGNPLTGSSTTSWEYEGKNIYANVFNADSTFMDFWSIEVLRDNNVDGGVWVTPGLLAELGLDEDAVDFPFRTWRLPIAGVIKDFHVGSVLAEQNPCKALEINEISNPWTMFLEFEGDPVAVLEQVREIYEDVSPIPLEQGEYFAEDYIESQYKDQRNVSIIMAIFASVAILISLLGLMAISTYYVQQRENEIAVRKVFGSTAAGIIRRVTITFGAYIIVAFVIAVPLAYHLLGDWLSQFSYRIPVYWWLFALTFALVMSFTVAIVYAQSRAVANSNPVDRLKAN